MSRDVLFFFLQRVLVAAQTEEFGVIALDRVLLLGKPDAEVHNFFVKSLALGLLLATLRLGRLDERAVFLLTLFDVRLQLVDVAEVCGKGFEDGLHPLELRSICRYLFAQLLYGLGCLLRLVLVEGGLDADLRDAG